MTTIDYRYLRAFQLTATYLNFSKAAMKLNIAQSAVSRQIKLLEESMNEQLIIRSSKTVVLTQKGKSLLAAIQNFEKDTDELTSSGPQLIKIGILHGLLDSWFIEIIKEFIGQTKHQLDIQIETPRELKHKMLEGKLDLIFTTENIQSETITSLRLFEEKLVLISKEEINQKDIHKYPWITYSESDFFFDLFKHHSDQIITIGSMTTIPKLVKAGVGIAIVPEHLLRQKDDFFIQELKHVKRPQIHLSSLNFGKHPPAIAKIISIIKNHVA